MTPRTEKLLLDAIVTMDVVDTTPAPVSADAYLCAAELARTLVSRELGHMPIHRFVGPNESLRCTAENVYFETHGHLPDVETKGAAALASCVETMLMLRLRVPTLRQVAR